MGSGSYVFAEWESIQKEYSAFRNVMKKLETSMITKCNSEWAPKTFSLSQPFGGDGHWGRTTILPPLFNGFFLAGTVGAQLVHWRQYFSTVGHQLLLAGRGTGYILPEDWKVAWCGLAFPNKNQHITEIKFQIGDHKYGRINLEEMLAYNKPALIFEDGFILDEEQAFELYGYVEGPIPTDPCDATYTRAYQRIVMLGFATYKKIDKALGAPGSAL